MLIWKLPLFISGSICPSSQPGYLAILGCLVLSNDVVPVSVAETSLVHYLWFLLWEKKCAPVTLRVYRATIASLADPLGSDLSDY